MIDFSGWEMPIQYGGVVAEHRAVRESAGLFDVSHMGEFLVFGHHATGFINGLITNDVESLSDGRCLYTPMCYESGTIVDDILVYRYNEDYYMLVVNAGNIGKDFSWIEKMRGEQLKCLAEEKDCDNPEEGLTLRNVSESTALLALQGPDAQKILSGLTEYDLSSIKRFSFAQDVPLAEASCIVSRTGYTGEDGFEVYAGRSDAVEIWDEILEAGAVPAGLGARDTLRLEAGLMLYGNDISDKTTPLEAPLSWTVKMGKGDFMGRDALVKQLDAGIDRRLVGIKMEGRGIPRPGYDMEFEGKKVGMVTSGTHSPTLGIGIALGYVDMEASGAGGQLSVRIRDQLHEARIVDLPFYSR